MKILSLHLENNYPLVKNIISEIKDPHNTEVMINSVLTSFRTWTASILNLIWNSNHRTKVDIYIIVCSIKMYLFNASLDLQVNLPATQELPLILGISKGEEEINSYFVSTTYSAYTLILTGKVTVTIQKKRIHFSNCYLFM